MIYVLMLCPLMHFFMMRNHKHHESLENTQAVKKQEIHSRC
ncbi:DUF2933 domain-containing protein [Desulfurispora thermophila]